MAGNLKLTPASALHISRHIIAAYGLFPNTSVQSESRPLLIYHAASRPLLIYHAAFESSSVTPAALEKHLNSIGAVVPQWRCTMYPTSHFHSTTHEVLAVSRLCFGSEDNPAKLEPTIPAGVAHRLMEDLNEGVEMVGSYPPGCNWDMCYGSAGEQNVPDSSAILCMAIAAPFSRIESSSPCTAIDVLANTKLSVRWASPNMGDITCRVTICDIVAEPRCRAIPIRNPPFSVARK